MKFSHAKFDKKRKTKRRSQRRHCLGCYTFFNFGNCHFYYKYDSKNEIFDYFSLIFSEFSRGNLKFYFKFGWIRLNLQEFKEIFTRSSAIIFFLLLWFNISAHFVIEQRILVRELGLYPLSLSTLNCRGPGEAASDGMQILNWKFNKVL